VEGGASQFQKFHVNLHKFHTQFTARLLQFGSAFTNFTKVILKCNVVDLIGLAEDRYRWRALVNSVMNLRVP
jgi:hypothetical protein